MLVGVQLSCVNVERELVVADSELKQCLAKNMFILVMT